MDTEFYLIVGLGNPGPKYAANRHNAGFLCLERLAAAHGLTFDKRQKKARVALGAIRGCRVVLAQPQTFMNDSGRSVAPLAQFYKVSPERLLVVYDELDLPLETLRMRPEGGSGGHKGMRSIIEQLEFLRAVLSIEESKAPHDSGERKAKRRELYKALEFIWSHLAPILEQ